ncbi:uncharacterized protein LOC120701268 [Panicum virgatum]|uniref:uncharacterized protein LOC120701268 n=1 Tax=Panicum virgatum TaxID=38727 RepID=UPI0019D5A6BF|nr:uncharacterized protein LOC120701268 [Panicum virgatum]
MNPLRRPAARREGTQASEIDGSTPAELDPGIGGGRGFSYEPDGTLRPGGGAAAGQGTRSGGGGLDLPSCAGFSLPSSCGAPVLLCCCCAPTADSRSSVGYDSERSSPTVADSPTAGSEMDSLLLRLLEDDSSSDEDYDVAAIMLADLAKNEQPKHGGSVQGHEVVRRNKQKGDAKLFDDYFAEEPVFGPVTFRRRFRMSKEL